MTPTAESAPKGTARSTARAQRRNLRERRRDLVAEMMLAGATRAAMCARIEAELGTTCSNGTISDDVRAVRRRWRERSMDTYDEHVAEQLAIIDAVIRGHIDAATEGHVRSAEVVLGALDRRERVLGLDLVARTRAEIDARVVTVEEAKVELVAQALEAMCVETGIDRGVVLPIFAAKLRALEAG